MFDNKHYLTCGVDAQIPIELQMFMWECIDKMSEPKDYLQVFRLTANGNNQHITHFSEQPEYSKDYDFKSENPITAKVYIIDDKTHSTMLLAEEY